MIDMTWEEKNQLAKNIAEQVKDNTDVLSSVLKKLKLGVVTTYTVVKEEDLLCEPIIWVGEDLETVTLEEWLNTRAYKTLNERSIEEGQEIKKILESMASESGEDQ